MMAHRLDFDRRVKLIVAEHVMQFGEGYRQIFGPTRAEGSADEMVIRARQLPDHERHNAYLLNEGRNPMTLDEVEQQIEQSN